MTKQHVLGAILGAVTVASLGVGAFAFAQTNTPSTPPQRGVGGTVSAVVGSTITLTGKDGKTYSIDAGSAAITKDMTVGISDIKVGDTLHVQGVLNGTSVTATNIHDGLPPPNMMGEHRMMGRGIGHGIHGTVSAVSGNRLMVSVIDRHTNSTSTYTVDATNAQVMLHGDNAAPTQGSVSSIKVGDTVMVAGDVSGTSVTAKMIFDGPAPAFGKKDR